MFRKKRMKVHCEAVNVHTVLQAQSSNFHVVYVRKT